MKDREQDTLITVSVEAWFAEHGFTLAISQVEGTFWADLVNVHGEVVAPRYGGGASATEAANRAKRRYLEEQ